jgi:chitin synthase
MNPLELEIYHQIKNVIGVNPSFYEYLFMVDADTTVDELSLNRLVSACMHDKKIVGICGETSIANAKQSIVTMSQVYEYFISHHLAKAFENLFGSITCLPGCFTMYRLRTPDTHKPLFIANSIIHDYSENRVDTLHLKNLLHLGEDRYLTTLVLKHFPTYKTKFVRDAKAQTVAPDSGKVLFSQRRRWINSTVHNMAELIFQENLCGFCCFSMRFIVLIDLISTIVAPVTVAYVSY